MIVHVVYTYETCDGKIFTDAKDAYEHETNYLYKKSGIRFYDESKDALIEDVTLCYQKCNYFTIDHSKKKENEFFLKAAWENYGYLFPDDVLTNKSVKKYRYDTKINDWVPVSKND